jgi:hypothetical protein
VVVIATAIRRPFTWHIERRWDREPQPAVLNTVPAASMAARTLPAEGRGEHPDAALSLRTATGLNHHSTALAPAGAAHLSLVIAPTLA